MLQFMIPVLAFAYLGSAQSGDCGLDCIADVSGTNCSQSEWTCLCTNDGYLKKLNSCASQACNPTDYDTVVSSVAEICAIFDNSITISPFATATTGTADLLLSTVAIPSASSLPPVVTSTSTSSASGSSSSIDNIAGTSISTFTTTGSATGSGGTASATASTTNIAQKADLRTTALHGIAVALLGLAVYL